MRHDPALDAIREALDPRRTPRAWQPAPARPGIWALTLHIAYWKYAVRRRLLPAGRERFRRHPANFPEVPPEASEAAWQADVRLLREEHERLMHTIDALPAAQLGRRVGTRKSYTHADLIAGIAMHDAYHAGQIQLLKRLWTVRRR